MVLELLFGIAVLAGLSAAAGTPTNASSLHSCTASMDGQLPSYTPAGFDFSGNVRRYYIAAEEVEWNYAPTGWDNWLGTPIGVSPKAKPFLQYGSTYLKALYRQYTDDTFTQLVEQPPWQGTQGPTLRSEVGDMIEILFYNKLSKNWATMHSMGLAYGKNSEGADYPGNPVPGQNSTIAATNAVPPLMKPISPGECVVYKWLAVNGAGPNDGLPARAHSYHSYIDLDVDTNSGLIGQQIVYARGQMESTMANYREFTLLYMIYNENLSFLSGENAAKLAGGAPSSSSLWGNIDTETLWSGNYSIWHPQVVNLDDSGRFPNASSYYTMSGYIFANNPTYQMCENDQVIWYVSAYGSASHVFHMHGNGFTNDRRNEFAVSLNDGVSRALYMNATGLGLWQVICHVNNHHQMGMVSNYHVIPTGQCELPALGGSAAGGGSASGGSWNGSGGWNGK